MSNETSAAIRHRIPPVVVEHLLLLDTETAADLVMRAQGIDLEAAKEIVKALQREGGEGGSYESRCLS